MRHHFEVAGATTPEQLPEIRRFVERFHRRVLCDDRHLISRVAVAAHELFENALKFATDGVATLNVDISRDATAEEEALRVRITTKNRANAHHVSELREIKRAIDGADDMMAFYVDLMRRSKPSVRGGLGLGRVAAESEMTVDIDIDDDRVIVTAELVVPTAELVAA